MPLSSKHKHPLPLSLFRADQVRELDRLTIDEYRIPGYELMKRAGEAAFNILREKWPRAHRIVVLCGAGNNAGDGYVLARCALEQGFDVSVMPFKPVDELTGDALKAAQDYQKLNGQLIPFEVYQADASDVIVDALLGTGLEREVEGELFSAIEVANNSVVPKLALDIPSGLHADTGNIMGAVIEADVTISFIGVKQGMFTASGPDCCGQIIYNDLQVPHEVFMHVTPSATRISHGVLERLLWKRQPSSHKGDNGRILIIGGDHGMMGAVGLAGEAALRVGAGMVMIATRPEHTAALTSARPELMCHGIESVNDLNPLLQRADVIAIGPGLGRDHWGAQLLGKVLEYDLPMIVDADGLRLLAQENTRRDNWILTPHPGEAGALLNKTSAEIQQTRFESVKELQQKLGGISILKGTGTLIQADEPLTYLCDAGNPGMGTGGMGDVLTGVIAGLLGQGLDLEDASRVAVYAHSTAADRAAVRGERGMLASDLFPHLRSLVNPE